MVKKKKLSKSDKLKKKCIIVYYPLTKRYYPMFNGYYLKKEGCSGLYRTDDFIHVATYFDNEPDCLVAFDEFIQSTYNVNVLFKQAF